MKKIIGLLAVTSFAVINAAQAEGDIENGRELSTQCTFCHGTYGVSSSEQFPNIAGQKESYLVAQLERYKTGERSDPTMEAIVGPLTAQDVEDLSAYYAANDTVASFTFETETLRIPYVNVGDMMYSVEMEIISLEDLSFAVSNLEER